MVWKNMYLCNPKSSARMVKLVDTLVSGTSGRKAVQVRVLFRALKKVGGFPPTFFSVRNRTGAFGSFIHPLLNPPQWGGLGRFAPIVAVLRIDMGFTCTGRFLLLFK